MDAETYCACGNEKSAEYKKGYEQGVKDFAERVKKYYRHLGGDTNGALVEYHINQIENDMMGEKQ